MKAFMTNGTYEFLSKLVDKYPAINFYFMATQTNTLAYYEADGKNIFAAGRAYDIFLATGKIQDTGYVVMNTIPVTEDGQAVFEDQFRNRQQQIESMPGFQAFRLLKPLKGIKYVVLTQWDSESSYENWKNSEQFKHAHANQQTKLPAYFADRPFITTYHMVDKDD